jgi:penicillin amidase
VSRLEAPVEIFRDEIGVPHARARSVHDAFFAQGFVHAQDRLWQMESDRRRASGRLAEILGPRALRMDIFCRRMGLEHTSRVDYHAFDADTRAVLDAYAAGVNAYLETASEIPLEFAMLDIEPAPWEPWQCGAVMKVRHVLMGNYDRKLWRSQLFDTLGAETTVALGSADGRDETLIVPVGARSRWNADPSALATAGATDGSNNWAVHGSRTLSGLPLVAGDPHRTLEVPNVYYQNHIACPSFDAIGISMPGVPGMFHFGHNAHVAWCVTHAMTDNQDLFVERFTPDDGYEFRGTTRKVERRTERIDVRDGSPVDIDVTTTHHGPVVFGDPGSGSAITMRWTGTDHPNSTLRALLPMLLASTVDEIEEAMRPWVDPCNNLVTADRQGTIAYLHRGRVPVRNRANGWTPVPGWTGEHEWNGDIPFENLPRLRNPDAGYIVTANNRISAGDDAYLGMDYAPRYRAERVLDRLRNLKRATAKDMAAIHADRVCLPATHFREAVARVVDWNGVMDPDSAGAAVYAVLREQLAIDLCEREPLQGVVENPFAEDPLPTPAQTRVRVALPRLIERGDTSLLDGRSWDDAIDAALPNALAWLKATLGDNPRVWRWDRIHTTRLTHPVARSLPEHAQSLNPSRIGCGGDADTVNCASWDSGLGIYHGSVARYVFDLGDWDRSGWVIPLGTSGDPRSPHYTDQAQRWAHVQLYPMTYSWDRIESGAESRQTLEPSR